MVQKTGVGAKKSLAPIPLKILYSCLSRVEETFMIAGVLNEKIAPNPIIAPHLSPVHFSAVTKNLHLMDPGITGQVTLLGNSIGNE